MATASRVLLVEDHAILREGLRALLANEPDLKVIGEAANGREALLQATETKPNLVLMDLSMPGTNGTEAIQDIKKRHPVVKVLVLTIHKTEEYIRASLRAGADGYILKDDSHIELLVAIRSILNGKTYLSPAICQNVVTEYLGNNSLNRTPASWETLTRREREVIKLIAEGSRNREIATYLSLSEKTVEKHRSNLMKKLNVHSASQLTAYAINNGLAH
ncbi:response regulator [Thiohalomonas denitrificans]|uniref:Two component transcriptional regulator, LuxR family n=1 Tax=Thiohalomonas denitrificans TaxID=415747 RepID=A0A1G5QCY4_9GAMM|nr:response regulator transcription factor [Thiohalomonas denitrificans]SCZ59664.1 two component transcriptional regulator, LuxR family [Thiohalomonas denitrificans]